MLEGIFVSSVKRDHSFVRITAARIVYGPFTVQGASLDAIVRPVLAWLELDVLPAHIEGVPCRVVGNDFFFVANGSARSGTVIDDDSLQLGGLYSRVQRPALFDINVATAAQLAVVPGFTAERGQAVVAHRESAGPFAAIDDLLKVDGVRRAALTKARPWLCVPVSPG